MDGTSLNSFRRAAYTAILIGTTTALAAGGLVAQGAAPTAPNPAARAKVAPARTLRRFRGVTVSPDGRRVAWVGPSPAADGGPSSAAAPAEPGVVVVDLSTGVGAARSLAARGMTSGSAHDLTWSSDGRQLAFLGESDSGGVSAIYLASIAEGSVRRVARIPGAIGAASFSGDGSRIAVLYSSPDEQANGPLAAAPRDTGLIDNHIDRQHLALIDVASGQLRVVTPSDLYVYEFDWAPDGQHLVVSAAHGSGNNNWWLARLYALDLRSAQLREIAKPSTQIAQPRWSPDGSTVAYIGGLMSDQGITGGDVYVVPAQGGEPRDVTPGAPVSVSWIAWDPSSRNLLVAAWAQGGSELATVDARSGGVHSLWSADELAVAGDVTWQPTAAVSADGRTVALVRQSLSSPPEVWAGPIERPAQLTHSNEGMQQVWGKAVSVKWRSDSFDVQGWLIYPHDFVAGQRYPLIVDVHGGPAYAWPSSYGSRGSFETTLSRAGYFVFMPNPRGSYGQGEAFTRANVKDLGYGDLRDIMAGLDTVVRRYPVDSARLGITGWSYGGFMTMWAVTQTNRFRAAVSGAGLSDWLSYTGENGISEWMVPYFGATAYEDPAVYAKSSPINFIDHAKTPTLVVVGERDVECPAPQSFEFWRGLQHAGATTQLIVYPDEGHGFRNPAHQRDVLERTVRWFDAYLKKPIS